MPFGQLVIGPPGSGKSTYCHGLHQFLTALERPVQIVNLDPAYLETPYPCALSITSLITLQDVMENLNLGPNGAMLYCMEYLEANIDWLIDGLANLVEEGGHGEATYIVFDCPGQVELSTDHQSLRKVMEAIAKAGWRMAAVHLTDAHHITDAAKYIAILILALRTMLQLELPHINVLSKIDLVTSQGDLPFNLDFYTEVQDLHYLADELDKDPRGKKLGQLNQAICDIVEDYGLVGFETLCVEDKMSMFALVKVIDKALGYAVPNSHSHSHSHSHHHEDEEDAEPPNAARIANQIDISHLPTALDIQEKWIDHVDAYKAHDLASWEKEGDELAKLASEKEKAKAMAASTGSAVTEKG